MRVLSYNPDSGVFTWLVNRAGPGAKIGKVAGCKTPRDITIRIAQQRYRAHRLAFLYMVGQLPPHGVDHIDGNPHNNCWSNLRACTQSENMQNQAAHPRNKFGLIGVCRVKGRPNLFQAQIGANGKREHLGFFKSPQAAHEAYLLAKKRLHTFSPIPRSRS